MLIKGVHIHNVFRGRYGTEVEKEITTHCIVLAWEIPWIEEPGGLHSMGSQSRMLLSTHIQHQVQCKAKWVFIIIFVQLIASFNRHTDFPGSPVVKIPSFQCRGCDFYPWAGN